jgi:hypothetical protein
MDDRGVSSSAVQKSANSSIRVTSETATLEVIQDLRPVVYKYKSDAEAKYSRFGFIAQEMETVLPSLVHTSVTGFKAISLKDLVAVLTLGLQSLDTVVDRLDLAVSALEGTVDRDFEALVDRTSAAEDAARELESTGVEENHLLSSLISGILDSENIRLVADEKMRAIIGSETVDWLLGKASEPAWVTEEFTEAGDYSGRGDSP